jgi:hypothetical protein
MRELMILLSAAMSEDVILSDLKEAIEMHSIVPSQETINRIRTLCMMVVIKAKTENDPNKATEMIKDLDIIDSRSKLFEANKN